MLGQSDCRLVTGVTIHGYEAIIMENASLRVVILTEKGTDIIEFLYKPKDCDVTWGTAWGLRPKGTAAGFLSNYEGGWQEIFPNGGTPCHHSGADFDQHDEVALLRWQWQVQACSLDHVAITFSVDLVKTPFRIQKTIHLRSHEARLTIEETIENRSRFDQRAMWGQHLAFGGPFVGPGCRIDTSAKTVRVMNEPGGPRRFVQGDYEWPWIVGVDGSVHDVSLLPEAGSGRDIVYLGDFAQGVYRICNPLIGMILQVEWDETIFPDCWFWQEFGADGYPWYGQHYNIGLEPFHGYPTHGLAEAVLNESAMTIKAGETVSTQWTVSLFEG